MADTEILTTSEPRANSGYLRALPVANGVLIAASLYSLAWCVFSILNHKPHLYLKVGPAVLAAGAALALKLRPAVRLTAMSLLIGAGVGIYSAELVATALIDEDRATREIVRTTAIHDGQPYDGRAKIDVIMELRRQGVPAYPPFYPYLTFPAPLMVDGIPTLPLGSVSNIVTVCCNEGGQYLIYGTDEHGFVNPPGLWKQAPVDVALVGASVATGECVPASDSIANRLRERYPKTISLGAGGNGQLMELGSIREYLPALRPARVLWIFPEAHPDGLEKEQHVPLLRYLDDSYEQRLMERQAGIDQAVRGYLEDATQAELDPKGPPLRTDALELLTLKRVRAAVFDLGQRVKPPEGGLPDADLYQRVLRRGQQIVSAWGGKISIVYVPDTGRYPGAFGFSPARRRTDDKVRASVLAIAGSLGIQVIDISQSFPDLPLTQAAQYDKYFYPFFAHYKPEGYRVMDRAILEALR
jgi:hypothetical protein